jgi:hypothetical protein
MTITKGPSKAWYLLPIFLGLVAVLPLTVSAQEEVKTYESTRDGIRVNYPADWIAEEGESPEDISPAVREALENSGLYSLDLVTFCPPEE